MLSLRFFPLLFAPLLGGCASGDNAVVATLQDGFLGKRAADKSRLNPDYRYLRVTVEGRAALMVLGSQERHPDGPIDVWYSAQREVLRLQNGRLVGAVGLTEEWRATRLPPLPAWPDLVSRDTPLTWTRGRDAMPGYRYGLRDTLHLRRIAAPSRSALAGLPAATLTWFEETTVAGTLPPARYALDPSSPVTVVYGEQCLNETLCLSWQRWPAGAP